jgi:hypothetical protein
MITYVATIPCFVKSKTKIGKHIDIVVINIPIEVGRHRDYDIYSFANRQSYHGNSFAYNIFEAK